MKSFDPAFRLTAAVMATADAFMRESQRLFRPHKLTGAQYNVLYILAGYPDGISQRELGDALVVDRSNVTGLLDRMQKSGWVRRVDDPDDRRIYRVSLTPSGRKLWEKVNPLYLEVLRQVVSGIATGKIETSISVLDELQKRAGTWSLPGHPPRL